MSISEQIETNKTEEEESTVGKLCWHVHHDTLAEFLVEELQVRADYIKYNKPESQIKRRLRLMKLVDPQPDWAVNARAKLDKAYAQLAEAQAHLADAQIKHDTAWDELGNVLEQFSSLQARLEEIRKVRDEAQAEWDKARDAFKAANGQNTEAARARWDEATRALDVAENQYRVIEAELKEVRARCSEAEAKKKNTQEILYKAYVERDEAQDAIKAVWYELGELLRKHAAELKKLHKKQCPNCPWDGESIFPQAR